MTAASILLGSILTFGTTDGRTLQLTVSLTQPSTVALAWGEIALTSSISGRRHLFRGLPAPVDAPITYRLSVGPEPARTVEVDPIGSPDRLDFAVYGDSREGTHAHRLILEQIEARAPDLILHTGDMVRRAGDEDGWVRHLVTTFPLSSKRPIILSLGNHELLQVADAPPVDGLKEAMLQVPPPDDPIARELGAPSAAFHVRVGPALFVSLDSNSPFDPSSSQVQFLERVLKEKGDAKFVFVSYHHGLRSSGPHGPHEAAPWLIPILQKYGVTASIAGHDHTYERIVADGFTHLVSGGGGAPLYGLRTPEPGSRAFATSYNWANVLLSGDRAELESFSAEGALLDQAVMAPLQERDVPVRPERSPGYSIAAVALLLLAFVWGGRSLSKYRPAQ